MSLWVGFSFAVLWALLISVTIIFENVYGFNRGEAGLVFWTILYAAPLIEYGTANLLWTVSVS